MGAAQVSDENSRRARSGFTSLVDRSAAVSDISRIPLLMGYLQLRLVDCVSRTEAVPASNDDCREKRPGWKHEAFARDNGSEQNSASLQVIV